MANVNVANIQVEPCDVKWGDEWLGFLDGDIEITTEEMGAEVTAHQEGTNVLDIIRTGKKAEIALTLKETAVAKITNLLLAGGETSTPAAEVVEITCDATAINGKYFDINTALDAIEYRVWIDVNNTGVAPAADGKTLVEVDVASSPTATQVATAVAAALDALAGFVATSDGAIVTVTNAATGACTDAVAPDDANFTFEVTTQGIGAVVGWGKGKDFASMLADAKKLVLHPIQVTASDLTRDVAFWKAYPVIDSIKNSGENPKVVSVTFKIFPDPSRQEAVRLFVFGDHR